MRLVLASASPRRRELLEAAGFSFDVDAADVDEARQPGENVDGYLRRVATAKAATVSTRWLDRPVLAADTVVVIDDEVLGKPVDANDAHRMLRRLAGREHQVFTGVALTWCGETRTAVERTAVWFADLTETDVERYVHSGEPMDKAGGYAIQGLAARFVEWIEGSYSNVVGLPMAAVDRLLRDAGLL